jgi:hypothetical protein
MKNRFIQNLLTNAIIGTLAFASAIARSAESLPSWNDTAPKQASCDRTSHIGKLDKAWDEAAVKGWTVVSMKDDWKIIFPK